MNESLMFLTEVFSRFGHVSARRMFGGYGLYHEGLMFALVTGDSLYLKSDAENVAFYEAEGLEKFQYEKQGKWVSIAYYEAPASLYDDPEEAALWARRAWGAAVRAEEKKALARARRSKAQP